ncbi:MAG TPA: hypothetical protein VMN35_00235 [Gaiellaceae bacterium]|nr:hypothetical protein [Gaiellaceae bacterium]
MRQGPSGEYLTFIRTNEDEFATAYTDTSATARSTSSERSLQPGAVFYAARRRVDVT